MAMAAFGDPSRFHDDFERMLTTDIIQATHRPPDEPIGDLLLSKDPVHPYLDKWVKDSKNE
ncbi:TPA: hypothetical protein EYN98_18525 [Candidatus Poribacteria bacterium]|nr:hypothetical protein [Candidatus Poribacteria bacterium]